MEGLADLLIINPMIKAAPILDASARWSPP